MNNPLYIINKYRMLYTRNKDFYRKNTAKVQHNQVRKNIINLVKQVVERDTYPKINLEQQSSIKPKLTISKRNSNGSNINLNIMKKTNQNKCTNNQIKVDKEYEINVNECHNYKVANTLGKETRQPIFCQSIYQSIDACCKHNHYKNKTFSIQNVIDYSIKSITDGSKSTKAQKQYISLLEQKVNQLQNCLKVERESINKMKKQHQKTEVNTNFNEQMSTNFSKQRQRLYRFYNKARNVIILQSVQLLEYKNMLNAQPPKQISIDQRIKSTNSILAKSEQLLQIYRNDLELSNNVSINQLGSSNCKIQRQVDIQQLKDQCLYQQKTIQFLRRQVSSNNQFNQIRLLRYQINRVCNQNQVLLNKLSSFQQRKNLQNPKEDDKKQIQIEKLTKETIQRLIQQIKQKQKKIEELNKIMNKNKVQIKQRQDIVYKLKEQKQYLMQLFQESRNKCEVLQMNAQSYKKQIQELKTAVKYNRRSRNKQLNLQDRQMVTTQQLCKQLKAYPKYFNLLMKIITQYEQKISLLQNKVCEQREQKQKFMNWSTQVYHFLQECQLPQQMLQKHMNQLYNLDRKMNCSNIQKFLRQIRALSIGIDDNQIYSMEAELQEYIISLKARNQVIKELDCEDGSSVAVSDTFTDEDAQQ